MQIYFVLYSLITLLCILSAIYPRVLLNDKFTGFFIAIIGLVTFLLIAFRYEVGPDWMQYVRRNEDMYLQSFIFAVGDEFGYDAIDWLGANYFGGIVFSNSVCAAIFTIGLLSFLSKLSNPYLGYLVAYPIYVVILALGFTRQSAAVGFLLVALSKSYSEYPWRYLRYTLLGGVFHKSEILLLLLPVLNLSNYIKLKIFLGISLLFLFYYSGYFDSFIDAYILTSYKSEGAHIRVLLNVIPACLLLLFRREFLLSSAIANNMIPLSIGAILSYISLLVFDFSALVDRFSYYFVPLQFFVYSNMFSFFNRSRFLLILYVAVIVLYVGIILFYWLNYSNNAFHWYPYKSYIFY